MARTWLSQMLTSVADAGRSWIKLPEAAAAPLDRARDLYRSLLSERGEASGTALARELAELYWTFDDETALGFFTQLSVDLAPNQDKLVGFAQAYASAPSTETLIALSEACEAPRQELLRRLNMAPDGTALLVKLRERLVVLLPKHPELMPLEHDLRHLLSSWFNRGFLQIERISWRTPALILEKLIEYEAVHEIEGWGDLRRRLAADRRCFAFFHPALRDEPLIFVEVALVKGLAASVQPLLAPPPADGTHAPDAKPDTAIFYSISNCQPGLRGISFGNFLIKQVVAELSAELPHLTCFSTLSPIPGFASWLRRKLSQGTPGLLSAEERKTITAIAGRTGAKGALASLLAQPGWTNDESIASALRPALTRLAAHYLTGRPAGKRPTDPVARFHLGNGARLERINWLGDRSTKGLQQSFGLMVNYRYELGEIEANHERFTRGEPIACSREIEALLTPPREPRRLPTFRQLVGARG
ncbi:MAG TPA: malonyl-CoA decarboxylase [Stellaceae bacterium]|nr:malonyl-CoA decarboxylase [Stellaceae bacterium]